MEILINNFVKIEKTSGDGYGSGYGSGSGYGYDYDYGSGYGFGDGDGSGNGYGDGDGISVFNRKSVYLIDGVQTIITTVKNNIAKGFILNSDFTLKKCFIVKRNNMFSHGDTLREAIQDLEIKLIENMPIEEKIADFKSKFKLGESYHVKEFYKWHNVLTGSCEMGRKSFAQDHDIDLEIDMFTVQEFIDMTKNSYMGQVIKQLEKSYNLEEK